MILTQVRMISDSIHFHNSAYALSLGDVVAGPLPLDELLAIRRNEMPVFQVVQLVGLITEITEKDKHILLHLQCLQPECYHQLEYNLHVLVEVWKEWVKHPMKVGDLVFVVGSLIEVSLLIPPSGKYRAAEVHRLSPGIQALKELQKQFRETREASSWKPESDGREWLERRRATARN
jgi:hypothetical protein